MKYVPVWIVCVALLSACVGGGSHQLADAPVANPYVKRAQTLAEVGILAMQRERWEYASNMFTRALKQAQLADDSQLVAQQWYNLGTANAAAQRNQAAQRDFSEAQAVAKRAGDQAGLARARLAGVLLLIQTGKKPDNENIWQPDVFANAYPVDVHLAAGRLAQQQHRRHVAKQEYELVLKQSSKLRSGLLYRGQAHLGLAMLARAEQDKQRSVQEVKASLALFRQIGAPRLLAHALLFYGRLDIGIGDRRDALQRALVIYQRLEDTRGQRDCLKMLVTVETQAGRRQSARDYQLRLNSL